MAVYTDIEAHKLEIFLSRYEIGDLLWYKGIAEGVENSNFLLQTVKGSYILTLYEKRVEREDLPFYLGLMQHLAKKGIVCPQPVTAKDGTIVTTLAGRPAAIVTFVDGVWRRKSTVYLCREVGYALAQLHLAGADFLLKRSNAFSIKSWRPLWDTCSTKLKEFSGDQRKEIDLDLSELEDTWPSDLPIGIIHADLFPDNVFFMGEKLSGLIDFYFACRDILAYDLAICINAWCFESDFSFNLTKGNALVSAYCEKRPLEKDEMAYFPLLARGAAMRFFLTRLYDRFYVQETGLVKKKDPREYLQKLRFFRQIRQISELGIAI